MISIIIPTFNEEKLIHDTLSRLKSSLTLPHEIIVSDGKSTDKTAELARNLADKVIVHPTAERQTISQGRNAGAKIASGEYLVFLDADCRIENPDELFSRAIHKFEKNPRLVAQAGWIKVFPERETLGDKIVWTLMNILNICINLIGIGGAPGELQMIRKESFAKTGGFNEKLVASEDYDMFYRLSKIGKTRLNPHLTVYHSGRHGHAYGWPKLLSIWFINTLSYAVRGKSYSQEWSVIR